jgi:hypothetical protein
VSAARCPGGEALAEEVATVAVTALPPGAKRSICIAQSWSTRLELWSYNILGSLGFLISVRLP